MPFRCEKTGANIRLPDGRVLRGDAHVDALSGVVLFRTAGVVDTDEIHYELRTWDLDFRDGSVGTIVARTGQFYRTDRLIHFIQEPVT